MNRIRCASPARAFTVIELLAVIAIICLIIVIMLPFLAPRRHGGGRQIKDASQVRGIQQALVIFANNNGDQYPLPSLFDSFNTTTAEQGSAKDHTANILSILIYQGSISPELCYSPSETNPNIVIRTDYEYNAPKLAVDPTKAVWDPGFAADFTKPNGSNLSYAHVRPIGAARENIWKNTFIATQPIFGNRGPEVSSVAVKNGRSTPTYVNNRSNTLPIHGGRTTWEGHIAYNDNHVNFENSTSPNGVTYAAAPDKNVPDNLFFDEPNDPTGLNAFLGVYTTGGPEKKDFKTIWD